MCTFDCAEVALTTVDAICAAVFGSQVPMAMGTIYKFQVLNKNLGPEHMSFLNCY